MNGSPPPVAVGKRKRRILDNAATKIMRVFFVAPAVLLLSGLLLYPIAVLFRMSVSDVRIANFLGEWPLVGLENLQAVFANSDFQQVLLQTFVFVAIVLVGTMGAGLFSALLIRQSSGVSLITQTTMVLVWTLPVVIVGSLWKFLLASTGPLNQLLVQVGLLDRPVPLLSTPNGALVAIAVVTVWAGLPFAALIMKSAILDVPDELLDAASVDGATKTQTFIRVILPFMQPTLMILGVLTVVSAFKAFDLIYIMTAGGPGYSSMTVPFLAYVSGLQFFRFGEAAAMSLVAMGIVLLLAIVYFVTVRKEREWR